jgi:hypothetical protein
MTNIAPLTRQATRLGVVLIDKGKDSLINDRLNYLIQLFSEWQPLLKDRRVSGTDHKTEGKERETETERERETEIFLLI